jgi:hypothetical protein
MSTEGRGRARSIEEFGAKMATLENVELVNYKPYEPQPGDVFITSWAKCGTTMMQQMFHQLRTGGDMDFDDISRSRHDPAAAGLSARFQVAPRIRAASIRHALCRDPARSA